MTPPPAAGPRHSHLLLPALLKGTRSRASNPGETPPPTPGPSPFVCDCLFSWTIYFVYSLHPPERQRCVCFFGKQNFVLYVCNVQIKFSFFFSFFIGKRRRLLLTTISMNVLSKHAGNASVPRTALLPGREADRDQQCRHSTVRVRTSGGRSQILDGTETLSLTNQCVTLQAAG